jgi:hypothetical protein
MQVLCRARWARPRTAAAGEPIPKSGNTFSGSGFFSDAGSGPLATTSATTVLASRASRRITSYAASQVAGRSSATGCGSSATCATTAR